MKTFHAFPLNPIDALASQVIIAGADGIAVASALKTINGQSLLGSGNISIIVDLTGYATTQYVDDEITANGASLQAYASNASNLASGQVPFARLPVGTTSVTVAAGNHTHTSAAISDFSEAVDDEVATLLQAGTDVTVTYNDAGNTLTVGLGNNIPRLNAANAFGAAITVGGAGVAEVTPSRISYIFGNSSGVSLEVGGVSVGPTAGYNFANGNSSTTKVLRMQRANDTTVEINNCTLGTLRDLSLRNLTASGVVKFNGYPTGLLPAAASNAGSITYDTTLAKHVGCNGSSWNALW